MNVKCILCVVGIIAGLVVPMSAQAAATLTVTPLTWNIIGLDSNNVLVGPNNFPVGARVCNTGSAASNVVATFVWDDGLNLYTGNPFINLRSGSLSSITLSSLGAGTVANPTCSDFYFEVTVTRDAGAYNHIRRYHITASPDSVSPFSTPTPRELFVEHLISQHRNGITDIKLNTVSIPAGGTMTLLVGNTYTIELDGFTATQGYNQLESFSPPYTFSLLNGDMELNRN